MEEEVTQKTIALSIRAAKLTSEVLKVALRKYLTSQKHKEKNPIKRGKQTYKELKSKNAGLSHLEIPNDIKSFERVAKEFKIDFALKKDASVSPPKYLVFFRGADEDTVNLAFRKYLGLQTKKQQKPSIMDKLKHFKEIATKGLNRERKREHQKDKGQSL